MLQEYTRLVQNIMSQPLDTSNWINYEVGPDGRYYLTGKITNSDLAFRNTVGFASWAEAHETSSSYGYSIPWEA